ncbi:hypothetical protein Dsin_010559 [Dipteronia sinensis]|uniref:RNase H type-1 domain-containing protein n=1 Tax=Dipteronia sinensis TaxID=43782 RepID=A0AAE0ATX4_9ROSI|nr:hypothetical protein Dsin_010559 [Dipteronia sinensis]
MVAWAIWEDRNSLINSGRSKCAELVVSGAEALLSEFQISKNATSRCPLPPSPRSSAEWFAPAPGRLKLNIAVAFRKSVGSIGVGAAIRDDKGLVLVARSNQLPGRFSHIVGVLMALREGLLLARFYNFCVDAVEVASQLVASIINNPVPSHRDSKFIVNDIKSLLLDVGCCKCQAISKSGNSLAHRLALLAFSSVQELIWLDLSHDVPLSL